MYGRRDGVEGVDFQTGDHRQMAVDDCRERASQIRSGQKTVTAEDVRSAQRKLAAGGYPYWENELAQATVEQGRRRGL